MRALISALLLLLAGSECFPGAGVGGSDPVRFGAGLCGRSTEIHRIEFRSADNEVLWRVDADPPLVAEDIEGKYGSSRTGFNRRFLAPARPSPWRSHAAALARPIARRARGVRPRRASASSDTSDLKRRRGRRAGYRAPATSVAFKELGDRAA
jgi:hypothetical protein